MAALPSQSLDYSHWVGYCVGVYNPNRAFGGVAFRVADKISLYKIGNSCHYYFFYLKKDKILEIMFLRFITRSFPFILKATNILNLFPLVRQAIFKFDANDPNDKLHISLLFLIVSALDQSYSGFTTRRSRVGLLLLSAPIPSHAQTYIYQYWTLVTVSWSLFCFFLELRLWLQDISWVISIPYLWFSIVFRYQSASSLRRLFLWPSWRFNCLLAVYSLLLFSCFLRGWQHPFYFLHISDRQVARWAEGF